jgi:2-dehydropantoate 2-reductase
MAYWLPPGMPSPFGGPPHLAREIVDTLRIGGCPAAVNDDVARQMALGSTTLIPLIAALEAAGWSIDGLRRDPVLDTAAAAARQANRVAVSVHGGSAGPLPLLMRAGLLRLLLPWMPKAVPFDLETYLRYHFTKVGAQTRQQLASYVERGRAAGLPVDAIDDLAARLGPAN